MSFLTPAFLIGLLGLGVPILLHLSRRRTKKAIDFPSLMFIQQVPYRSMRRRRLRDVLLLALRCAAVGLLAFAFARPLTSSDRVLSAGEPREELVVLLDRSFSMGYGERWSRALEAVRESLAGLGRADSVTLVAFDESAEALNQPTSDVPLVEQLLDDLEPGDRITRYAPALRLARTIVLDSELAARRVLLITDFQRSGSTQDSRQPLPVGVELEYVDVSAAESGTASNVSIAEVRLERQREGARERVAASARLVHQGDNEQQVRVALEVNGRQVEERTLTLTGEAAEMVRFEPLLLESGVTTRGQVRIFEDALEADNSRRFAVSSSSATPVLLVNGSRRRGPSSVYLSQALQTARQPPFAVTERAVADLRGEDFSEAAAIVFHDSFHLLTAELRQRLERFVNEGGGVLLALGPGYDQRGLMPAFGLGGDEPVSDTRTERAMAQVELGHEIFSPFAAARSGDFSRTRFFRYRRFEERPEDAVLARLDNGDPVLIERRLGLGRILLWPASLDAEWSDLVLQGVFVPWIDHVARYLSGYAPPRDAYLVGQVAELEIAEDLATERWLILSPDERRQTVDGASRLLVPLDQKGFWEVRPVDGEVSEVLAVNVDVAESDLRRIDPEELQLSWSQSADSEVTADGVELARDPSKQKIWWVVLLALLVLLGAESLFSNRRFGGLRSRTRAA